MTERPLEGRIAFVTGSGRGLGRAMADRLAALGADVAIHDRDAEQPAKYGEAKSLDEVAREIGRHGGRVAAVLGDIGATGTKPDPNNALDVALEDIQAETQNNLIGTMLVTQVFVRPMRDRRSGCVVNIASAAAHRGHGNEVVYSTLKAAVVHYTRCLASELRPYGVRVNAVSPGATKTARFQATRQTDPAKMQADGSLVRYAQPEEIADAVAFLAGPQARFVNGQVLRVDGGLTLYPG